MIKKIVTAAIIGVVGYAAGLLFGYRAAVVDYVENDAKTIRSMADTMYDSADSFEDLPEEVKEQMREQGAAPEEETESDDRDNKGFR